MANRKSKNPINTKLTDLSDSKFVITLWGEGDPGSHQLEVVRKSDGSLICILAEGNGGE